MKYMFLIYGAEDCWTEVERKACMVESMRIGDELARQGKYIDSAPLQSVSTAATVRVRNGQTLVTDGPFAETTEQLGGYYVLDLADLDEAIAVASRLPPATKGTVEIRPILALEGLPAARPSSEAEGGSPAPYLLLCYHQPMKWDSTGPEAFRDALAEAVALCRAVSADGKYLSSSPLHPAATATCVRIRDGKREITDGPFAETNEVLGGYYLVLAESCERAVAIAARTPGARAGSVEVRPLFNLSSLRSPDAKKR